MGGCVVKPSMIFPWRPGWAFLPKGCLHLDFVVRQGHLCEMGFPVGADPSWPAIWRLLNFLVRLSNLDDGSATGLAVGACKAFECPCQNQMKGLSLESLSLLRCMKRGQQGTTTQTPQGVHHALHCRAVC